MFNGKEIWKDICEYEGAYQVSNFGRIKSLKRFYKPKESIKKPHYKGGYLYMMLHKNNIKKDYPLHRLVLSAFKGFCNSQINHKDGNKQNNHVDNLEWCTASENLKHAYRLKLRKPTRGESHPMHKLSESNVKLIRKLHKESCLDYTPKYLANVFNCTPSNIRYILSKKSWKYV